MFADKVKSVFRHKDVIETKPTPVQVPVQQSVSVQDPTIAQRASDNEKLFGRIEALGEEMGRLGNSLSKALDSNASQLQEMTDNLARKLDEIVLSVRSASSDDSSPFNSMEHDSILKHGELEPDTKDASGVESLGMDSDVRMLVVACGLLEISGKSKRMIDSLHALGLLSRDHLRTIARVRELLSRLGTTLRPRELAQIVCHLPKNRALDEDTLKILDFLSSLERGGETCQAMS